MADLPEQVTCLRYTQASATSTVTPYGIRCHSLVFDQLREEVLGSKPKFTPLFESNHSIFLPIFVFSPFVFNPLPLVLFALRTSLLL